MAEPSDLQRSESAKAELRALQEQVARTRLVLSKLQQDVADATALLASSHAAHLLEANEQLVHAALHAHANADTAAAALNEVLRLAELDTLTGLTNRVRLLDRLTLGIANAKRRGGRLALLFLDLDDFKEINDTLSHSAGDQVLRLAARRLTSSVREADTVSRYGGDEFVIVISDVAEASDALVVAEKIRAALAAPSRVGEHTLVLSASIGISIYPDDSTDGPGLIDRADAAMYRAKNEGLGSALAGDGERAPAHAAQALQRRPSDPKANRSP